MTVGIAALAEKRGAIVLIADKQFTDMISGLKVEGHEVKGFRLEVGWIVLYAGDSTFADTVINRAESSPPWGRWASAAGTRLEAVNVRNWLRQAYESVYEEEIDSGLFRPSVLDKDKFKNRTYDDATIRSIEARVEAFQEDETCALLACGFDESGEGQVIRLDIGTTEIADSFAAIGSGDDLANAHLAWRRTQSPDRLQRVVYETYEAKMHAESNAYVGKPDYALVMFGNELDDVKLLTEDTKDILRRAIVHENFTPFRRPGVFREHEKREARQRDWERVLTDDKLGPIITEVRRRNEARGKP